jgi:hypothetical protein
MSSQEADELIRTLKIEKKMLEDRLDKVQMQLRLIIIKEAAKDVNARHTIDRRR